METSARILIADDEAHAREALDELLRDEGYDVYLARDGAQAYGLLAAVAPDLLLSDAEMPRMGDRQLAEAMCAMERPPALVRMSARQPPAGAPVGPRLQKPIVLEQLLAVVERALADRRH